MKGFIGGIPVALLAVAAQAKFAERVCPLPLHVLRLKLIQCTARA